MTKEKFELEINTLKTFLELYCKDKHEHQEIRNITLIYNSHIFTLELNLCENCYKTITYSFMNDTRENKHSIVPTDLQIENLILAEWYASTMQKKVDDKFNQKGWFVCKKDKKTHVYNQIGFGNPISFEQWISMVKTGDIFFDSGMYQGNNRPYSQWRANNTTIDKLLVRSYP